MDGVVLFVSFVLLIISLWVDYLIAKKFMEIAEMKGHDGGSYFWWTFLAGPVGMAMVIALPYIGKSDNGKAQDFFGGTPEHITITKDTQMRCENCNQVITGYPCEHCGFTIEKYNAPYWCGKCGKPGPYEDHCPACGSSIRVYNNS